MCKIRTKNRWFSNLAFLANSTTLLFLQYHPYITEIQVVPKPEVQLFILYNIVELEF